MRAAGLDSKIISATIGHSSVVITQDRYTHVDRSHLADAAAQLDSYLAQTGCKVAESRERDRPG